MTIAWRLLAAMLLAVCGGAAAHDTDAATADPKPGTAAPNVHVLAPLPMPALARERAIRVYLPPGYDDSGKRYPVLYLQDGQNLFDAATSFLGEWNVDETLIDLARERGIELIVVGIDNGDRRLQELGQLNQQFQSVWCARGPARNNQGILRCHQQLSEIVHCCGVAGRRCSWRKLRNPQTSAVLNWNRLFLEHLVSNENNGSHRRSHGDLVGADC